MSSIICRRKGSSRPSEISGLRGGFEHPILSGMSISQHSKPFDLAAPAAVAASVNPDRFSQSNSRSN